MRVVLRYCPPAYPTRTWRRIPIVKKSILLAVIIAVAVGLVVAAKQWLDPSNYRTGNEPVADLRSEGSGGAGGDDGSDGDGGCCRRPYPGANEFPVFSIAFLGIGGLGLAALTLRALKSNSVPSARRSVP